MAKKSAWLQEVEEDAIRITKRRIQDFKEEQEIKKAKAAKELNKKVTADVAIEKESK
jgi:hypothetical protein